MADTAVAYPICIPFFLTVCFRWQSAQLKLQFPASIAARGDHVTQSCPMRCKWRVLGGPAEWEAESVCLCLSPFHLLPEMWVQMLEWKEAAGRDEDEGYPLKVAGGKDGGAWVSDGIVEPSYQSWNGDL